METSILIKNEKEANKFAAIITLITIVFIALVYFLNVIGVFVAPQKAMTIAMGIATLLMLIPPVIVFVLKLDGVGVKYVIVITCSIMVSVMSMLLTWHVVLMYIYPIAISSIYFSRKLSWFTLILSIILLDLGQIASLYMGGIPDDNLADMYETIVYGIGPRSIELLAISLIFIVLSKRTKNLLQNVVGAEEEKHNLEKIKALSVKSYEVSNTLAKSVSELTQITENTKISNEKIAEKTSIIVDESQQTIAHVSEAGSVVSSVTGELNKIANENSRIAEVSKEAMALTEQNSKNMRDAAEEMKHIDNATKESKDVISKLSQKSNEIANFAEVIKEIAKNTNLLALNASIESARAGEQGKGFAVVASNIRELAEQSQGAANTISELIKTVLEDTTEAVNSMDLNTKIVENGLTYINKVEKSSAEVNESIEKMNHMASNIATLSNNAAVSGEKINTAVEEISKLTYNNIDGLKTIMVSTKEQLTSMNEVAASVNSIHSTAQELTNVVEKTNL